MSESCQCFCALSCCVLLAARYVFIAAVQCQQGCATLMLLVRLLHYVLPFLSPACQSQWLQSYLPHTVKPGMYLQPLRSRSCFRDAETGRDPTRVKVFDTTLRDGEQSPGCTMTREEKLVVARQLSKLGVDVIEAGFPIASPGDFQAVQEIAQTVGMGSNPPIICGLARALKKDIDVCAEAVRPARFPRIHTFIATSDIHMEHKLKKTREQVIIWLWLSIHGSSSSSCCCILATSNAAVCD